MRETPGEELDQAMPNGECAGLGPVHRVRLVEDVADVVAHSPDADDQLMGYLSVRFATRNQSEHFDFSFSKARGIYRTSGWHRLDLFQQGHCPFVKWLHA